MLPPSPLSLSFSILHHSVHLSPVSSIPTASYTQITTPLSSSDTHSRLDSPTPSTSAMSSVASSSKRPAPSLAPPSKRSRTSLTHSLPDASSLDESDDETVVPDDVSEGAQAKVARKHARVGPIPSDCIYVADSAQTIRNRESAQRSRNQRKEEFSSLKARVIQLEAENKALKSASPPPASPERTVDSLTMPLTGGMNLASVAPPPADLDMDVKPVTGLVDVKPDLPVLESFNQTLSTASLQAENTALRERVALLENLVKQVVALSDLGGISALPTSDKHMTQSPLFDPDDSSPVDWDAVFTHSAPDIGLDATLSPAYPTPLPSSTSTEPRPNPLARHPAAVATPSPDGSLQRARSSLVVTTERLGMAARVVVALARRKGWTTRRVALGRGWGCGARIRRKGRIGMRR